VTGEIQMSCDIVDRCHGSGARVSDLSNGDGRVATSSLAGLHEPWGRLQALTQEAQALAAANRELTARVASLEHQLDDAGRLTDDELIAQLPKRMSRALESAQEVAEELVGRAKHQEEVIRQRTDAYSTNMVSRAESEATAILRRAAEEAVRTVNDAKREAQAALDAAHARREKVLLQLQQRAEALEERVKHVRREHNQLVAAYQVVDRTLAEARSALRAAVVETAVIEDGVAGRGQRHPVRADAATVYDTPTQVPTRA
jgi:cell division septum initiation protein DivIVA